MTDICVPEKFEKSTYQEFFSDGTPADKLNYALHGKFNGASCIYGYVYDEADAKNIIETHNKLQKLIAAVKGTEAYLTSGVIPWENELTNLFDVLQECEKEG